MGTFRRLLGFLRPHRKALWGSLVFAWAAMGMTVLIPWLIGQAVDAIESGDRPELLPLSLAIIGAGVLRLGLTVVRRLVAGKVSLEVEFELRERIYRHLQTLELGFFDSQQTGQLMSRATVDLQSIRFFLGYGLIFITQNLLTIALASAVMIAVKPSLALLALAPAPLVVLTAARYNRQSRPALQEVQQRIAELTAEAEENVSGIRIVKAFAREEHQLQRFRRAVGRVFDQSVYSNRLRAFYTPLIGLLPAGGDRPRALRRRARGDQRQPHARRVHCLLHLHGHSRGADADARDRTRHGAARGGLGQPPLRDPRPRAANREPGGRRPLPPGEAASSCAASACATRPQPPARTEAVRPPRARRRSQASTSTSPRAARWPWSAPRAPARPAWWR